VGVVKDTVSRFREYNSSTYYRPLDNPAAARLVVRTAGDAAGWIRRVQEALLELEPTSRRQVRAVKAYLERDLLMSRLLASGAGALAAFALLLAVIGLAGVTALAVSQRRREIGIRLALGSTTPEIVALLTRQGLVPVIVGLSVGLFAALGTGGVIASALIGVGARDPVALASAVAVLLVAAVLAVALPARRAAGVDPARVLREG
jgi:ABC-type antimicrobial peptide transport system permease subunit